MTASLDEYRQRLREQPQLRNRVNELKGLAQEVPRMAALTGSETWDHFSRYLEAQIRIAEAEIEVKRNQAASLVLVDEAKAKAAAVIVTALESRAQTLRDVILLPKWLMEQGEKAAELVAQMQA